MLGESLLLVSGRQGPPVSSLGNLVLGDRGHEGHHCLLEFLVLLDKSEDPEEDASYSIYVFHAITYGNGRANPPPLVDWPPRMRMK